MKKLLLMGSAALCYAVSAFSQTATYYPTEDAFIWRLDNDCVLSGTPPPYPSTPANVNFGSAIDLPYMDWTWNGSQGLGPKTGGCPHGTIRSLIRFGDLSNIPPCARIERAILTFHGIPQSACAQCWDSWPSSNPGFYANPGFITRALAPWNETSVTWNNFGGAGGSPIPIPPSTASWGWNPSIDVTSFVQAIVNGQPNYGWQLALATEATYRRVEFASRDYPDSTYWPTLRITFAQNVAFTYCYNTNQNPQTNYTLQATYPNPAGTTYNWLVNNVYVGSGMAVNVDLANITTPTDPTDYKICLQMLDANNQIVCEKCNDACVVKPYNATAANGSEFDICQSTLEPGVFRFSASNIPASGTLNWSSSISNYGTITVPGPGQGPVTLPVSSSQFTNYTGPSLNWPNGGGVYLSYTPLSGTPVYTSNAVLCKFQNQLRPINETGVPNDGTIPRAISMAEPDDVFADGPRVTPNPTKDGWSIDLVNLEKEAKTTINLFDITGKVVYSQSKILPYGSNVIAIPGDGINEGVYIVEIRLGNNITKQKIVKLK